MNIKICSVCKKEFMQNSNSHKYCSFCQKYIYKLNELKHKKIYYQNNKTIENIKSKNYYETHKKQSKKYQQLNKIRLREYGKKYSSNRRKIDINFKISMNLRNYIHSAIKRIFKSKHTLELLGCSIEQLKKHLESQFQSGMTWSNWGTGFNGKGMKEWHIDHIKPCISFDLCKTKEQLKCFHYTNLQPLWAKENLSKGNKY